MKKGLIVLVAMFLPMSLFGSTELIYAWGYGSSLNEALQALKGLTSEADYIIKSALAIAVLVFSISKALDSKSSPVWEIGKLVLLYGIVYHFFLSPSNNTYVIHDEVSGNDYKVSKLPSGLGNTVSLMSRLEKVILDGMEKHYSTPNSIAYSQAGLGFSLSAMMDIPTLRITRKDALMQSNMNYYVKSCYSNNLGIRIHQNSVLNSSDLAQTILLEKDGKLVYWQQDDGNGGIKSSIISCGEAATMIKKGFLNVADLIQNETAIKNVIVADYLNKFQNVAQLYFGQAAGSREQFQQILVMNALDDGIINTAKMLGLNPQSFAANTAIADQTITTSMQSQGRLAQTYLPLAKAYMTIIVISVSWLMAIISIMFGSYTHIKMFFTLCLTMVLWTPILSIINFLNDLNIQHTFGVINQNDAAFTYSNYKEVIQKVTANSNFLNYLVMLTPMLAYALAKGSEMGFVSIASSLSQQLAGASRAASSFATQQALSTSTAITTPKGDEVYALQAGIESYQNAFSAGGGRFSTNSIAGGGSSLRDANTGTAINVGADGNILNANVAGVSANQAQAQTKTAQHTMNEQISNALKSGTMNEAVSNYMRSTEASVSEKEALQQSFQKAYGAAWEQARKYGVSEQEFDKIMANGGAEIGISLPKNSPIKFSVSGGGSISTGNEQTETASIDWGKVDKAAIQDAFTSTLQNEFAINDKAAWAFGDAFKTHGGQESAKVAASIDAFTTAKNYSQAVSTDNMPIVLENYIQANQDSLGHLDRLGQVAAAGKAIEGMAARGDQASILGYAGMDTNQPNAGNLTDQAYKGLYNPNAAKIDHNKAVDAAHSPKGEIGKMETAAKQTETAETINDNAGKAAGANGNLVLNSENAATAAATKNSGDNLGEAEKKGVKVTDGSNNPNGTSANYRSRLM